jgi:putative nucleotidyltransferase with HDIG domain
MWIHSIQGSWFSHPFWKARFLLQSPEDVAMLRNADIDGVTIDTDRGCDVEAAPRHPPVATPDQPQDERTPPPPAVRRSARPCGMAAEIARATRIARQSKEIMSRPFDQARLGKVIEADALAPLVADISASLTRNRSTLTSILRLKHKDEYTYMHSVSVGALMVNLARELDMDEDAVRDAGTAGLLHDIGKVAVPAMVLNKPGALTDAEFAAVKTHPERGYALLRRAGRMPEGALEVCLHHHEKIDGSGYPHGLKGDEISLLARMGAICDVYDALTSNRPYKAGWRAADAIQKMQSWAGHFDPRILSAFIRCVGIYPVGSLVRLRSDRLAVVTEVDADNLTRPMVRAFMTLPDRAPMRPHDINLRDDDDAIVSVEDPADWSLIDWEQQWPRLARASRSQPVEVARHPGWYMFDQRLTDIEPEGATQVAYRNAPLIASLTN